MTFLFVLLILITIGLLALGIYTLHLLKTKDMHILVKFLDTFIYIVFGFLCLLFIANIIFAAISVATNRLAFIQIIKNFISLYFFFIIFKETKFLMNQLKNQHIFDVKNADSTLKIGKSFILLTSIELITGIALGIFKFIVDNHQKDFTLEITITPLIYFVIGFLLIILSMIYRKSVAIYEENQLTI